MTITIYFNHIRFKNMFLVKDPLKNDQILPFNRILFVFSFFIALELFKINKILNIRKNNP